MVYLVYMHVRYFEQVRTEIGGENLLFKISLAGTPCSGFMYRLLISAWKLLTEDKLHPLDCIERSLSETCEVKRCTGNVGPYGNMDEQGDFSLDAMMMDG